MGYVEPEVGQPTYHLYAKVEKKFEKMSEIAWFNIYVIIVKKVRVKQGQYEHSACYKCENFIETCGMALRQKCGYESIYPRNLSRLSSPHFRHTSNP